MQFRLVPLSGNLVVLDAKVTSVARLLFLLRGRRIAWVVLRDGEKYFVFSTRDVLALLKSVGRSHALAVALRLNRTKPSQNLRKANGRISLARDPAPGTATSRAVVLRKSRNGSTGVSAIGILKRDLKSQLGARKETKTKTAKEAVQTKTIAGEVEKRSRTREVLFGFGDSVPSRTTTPQSPKVAHSFSVIDVFYATDREAKTSNSSERMVRYLNRLRGDGELDYGICSLTIPDRHHLGKIESPSIWSFEIREDPAKHFTVCACVRRTQSEFSNELQPRLKESEGKSCFVFIHGYNVSFEDAAKRTAQLACDLKFLGVPILYSWASAASWRKYPKDVETVDMTIDSLSRFLANIVQESDPKNIHLIAHSMGNRALVKALKQMSVPAGEKPFCQIVLTAPDVPRQNVEPLIKATSEKAERVTLYASKKDKALGLSKVKNDYERLGKVYGFPFVLDGMDSIDASSVKTDFWEHSAFAKARTVLGDLASLVTTGFPPDKRFGLKRVNSPNGLSWRILP